MHFEILEPSHVRLLKPFFDNQSYRLSIYSLASVMAWRDEDGFLIHFAIEDDTLFMTALNPDRPTQNYLALPMPTDGWSPRELYELSKELGLSYYDFVPEEYIEVHGQSSIERFFSITEQKAFEDYIYLTKELVELKGNRFSKKRNLIHQFEREYVLKNRVEVEEVDEQIVPECLDFLTHWFKTRDNIREDGQTIADNERAAYYTIEEFSRLELSGIVVRIDRQIAGLGTCCRINDEMGALNLEMALPGIKGLYQFLDRECTGRLFLDRFKYINKESDMGMAGLRQSKRSYYPKMRAKCFKLAICNRNIRMDQVVESA